MTSHEHRPVQFPHFLKTLALPALLSLMVGCNPTGTGANPSSPPKSSAQGGGRGSDLVLRVQGPFLICENSDHRHLDLMAPNLVDIAKPKRRDHFDPAVIATNNDFAFQISGRYALDLKAPGGADIAVGKMAKLDNGPLDFSTSKGECDAQNASIVVQVPVPDEILPAMPVNPKLDAAIVEMQDDPPKLDRYTVVVETKTAHNLATIASLHYSNVDLSRVNLVQTKDSAATKLDLVNEFGNARLDLDILPYQQPDDEGYQRQASGGYYAASGLVKNRKRRCLLFLNQTKANCGARSATFDADAVVKALHDDLASKNLKANLHSMMDFDRNNPYESPAAEYSSEYWELANESKTHACGKSGELICQKDSTLGVCQGAK